MNLQFEPLSPLYLYVRGRQLEGTYSDDSSIGAWPISAARVARGWGNASEAEWPNIKSASEWPPPEPPNIDVLAKPRRVNRYQRVRDASDCIEAIRHYINVYGYFDITNQWFNASNGDIDLPQAGDQIIGGHCVCVDGFDQDRRRFHFPNSWGTSWGNRGRGTMPFDYFDQYLTEGWAIAGFAERPPIPEYRLGVQYLNWGVREFRGSPLHVMEVYDFSSDDRMGWVFAVHRDNYLDIEEFFVKPSFRRQGYGRKLLEMVLEIRDALKLPLRFWIPHPDYTTSNMITVERLLARCGLSIQPSENRWASAKAVQGDIQTDPLPPIAQSAIPRMYWDFDTK